MSLRLIGYWRSEDEPEWPDPADLIDDEWDPKERGIVAMYLAGGRSAPWRYMGFSTCRICGRHDGAGEYLDDVFLWPEGLAHYVMDHSVRLPEEIIEHIKHRVAHDMSLDVDRTWWQSIRPG